DFALPNSKEMITNLVNQLNGSIILILGNHDRRGKQWFLDCGFIEVHKKLKTGNYLLTHRPQTLDRLDNDVVNIHGHAHGNDGSLDKRKYINVSCEVVDYTPIWIDLT
ncbi:MAG TPA: phosphoesterase, partial [Gallicola sp.]|nr:phosphoesterase [Gallicola sp.]